MRILYYDCFSGISGDMNLGMMIDLGVDFELLKKELAKLGVKEEYEIVMKTGQKLGITGTKVDVILKNQPDDHHHHHESHSHSHEHSHDHHDHDDHHHLHESDSHSHEHSHDHHDQDDHHHHHEGDSHSHEHSHDHHDHDDHHHHHESHSHSHAHSHTHEHRGYKDIEAIINGSDLSDRVKELSLNMFMKVAVAEGKVHGKPYDEVHFHEVGATDSIVDIVGSAICLEALGVDQVWSSTVELGGGFVKCAHGLMPVPAPATAEILRGAKTKTGRVQKETTTPTGAAILAATVSRYTDQQAFEIEKIGYGLGTRDMEIPNVVRGILAEVNMDTNDTYESDEIVEIEANIDDMNPEHMDYVMDLLYKEGALEAFQIPVMMKKGRMASLLTVIAKLEDQNKLSELILQNTTAIGCRYTHKSRMKLKRVKETCHTIYGDIDVKIVYKGSEVLRYKGEYDQIKQAAIHHDVTLYTVEKALEKAMEDKR